MLAFEVHLDAYHGPLDLLLYLVKKEELPISELPLAVVTQQYLDYVAVIERLDPNAVGDFLDVASLLLEIKSRSVLPSAEEAAEGQPLDDETIESTGDLVQRLLEFKEYRDAAAKLETLRLDWSKRYTRTVAPSRADVDPADQPIEGVELWDLVSAFARVMRDRLAPAKLPETIYYDETPIHKHMLRIDALLRATAGPVPFEDLFPEGPVHKSTLVGVFLAMLELIRYRHALAHQPERYGPITLEAGPAPLDVSLMS